MYGLIGRFDAFYQAALAAGGTTTVDRAFGPPIIRTAMKRLSSAQTVTTSKPFPTGPGSESIDVSRRKRTRGR